jgi:hypothetical protein
MLHRQTTPRCGTCHYYELSPLGGQGWCQHPRMTGNGQYLRLVSERKLDCAHRMPVFWEAAEKDTQPDWEDGGLVTDNASIASGRAE